MKKAPVGIGIVGTGFARTTQIPGFRDCMGAKVVAIASGRRERAEVVANEFGIEHVADDWQDLVARNDVDLVSIVTPPATHMEITLAALEQRKAVLCEKPMALNAEQSARMVEKANAAGVLALIDHELRFLNSRRTMRGMLQTGAIGTVRHCNYVFRSDYRALADRAWDWWSDEKMGGGTLGAIGSHVIDSFRWMLETEVSKTLGMLSTHIKQRNVKSSGEARVVTTDDEVLWSRMWSYKDHGKSWKAVYERQHPPGYRWVHESFGTNWRMLEMQAVLGRVQLRRMAEWTERRTDNARAYVDVLRRYPGAVRIPVPRDGLTHAYYRLYAYVRPEGLRDGWSRDRIVAELNARDIPAFQGSCSEVYLEKAFDGTGLRPADRLPIARELGETSLAFLTHPTLSREDVERTCAAIEQVLAEAAA